MKPPARIQLRLLGRLALAYSDVPAPIRLSTRKAGALIAYVAMSPEQTASREQLATLLWGGCTDQQARQSLRQALALLRKDLRSSHFFGADTAVVRLQPGFWSVDAREFESLSTSSDPKELARAAGLLDGEFLAGLNIDEEGFDEWVNVQRQRMQLAASRLCETYAARPDLVSDGQQAVAVVEQLMALDPLREDWQRLALTLYARYRGKNEALAQAEIFAATLQRELGVAPEKQTRALLAKIRAGEIALEQLKPIEIVPPQATAAPQAEPLLADTAPAAPASGLTPEGSSGAARQRAWTRARAGRNVAAALALAGVVAGVVAIAASGLAPSHWFATHVGDTVLPAPIEVSSIDRWRPPRGAASAAAEVRLVAAIAVLPFATEGDAAELQPAADAITDDLINMLARTPVLRVISRQTMQSYRGQAIDVTAMAAELGVNYVLEGVVRKAADQLRVNVELIDPATRSPIWSARVERGLAEEGKARDEIALQLARELQVELPSIDVYTSLAAEEPSLRQLNQQGWAAIYASGRSPEALQQAELAFSQALAKDPQSWRARIGLANYHALAAALAIDADASAHLTNAEKILQQLISERPNGSGVHFAMAIVHHMRGRLTDAIESFQQMLATNPSHAPSYAGLGYALVFAGKASEGLEYIQYAQRLSPRDLQRAHWLRFAGEAELELGHHVQAIELLRQSLAIAPGQPQTLRTHAVVLAAAGRIDEARVALAEMRKINPTRSDQRLLQAAERFKAARPEFLRGLRLALASSDDPWQPPTPADQAGGRAAVTQPSGLTAILILPFTSIGEPSEQSTLSADLMTDDLTNALSRAAGFRVISRQTAMSYRGQQVDPAAVGTELGVHYVLEGRVEAQGSTLRASVELIDTRSRLRMWSGRYDRIGTDRTKILDDMIRSVGRELQLEVTHAEGAVAAQDPDVHALIYKGFSAMADAGRAGQPALEQSKRYFTHALAREPDNPRALTGLGMYHVQMAVNLYASEPAPHLAEAEAILLQVIERHPGVGGPYRLMGVLNIARGRAEIAAQWLQREIEINPSDAPSYAQLGRTMTMRGHAAEGIKYILYAMRLSPRDQAMAFWLGMAAMAELEQGHDHKAIEYLDRQLSLKPGHPRALIVLAAIHALSGNPDAARVRLEQLRKALPHLSGDKLIERYFGGSDDGQLPRFREGLRLALAQSVDPWQSPHPASALGRKEGVIAIAILPFAVRGKGGESSRATAEVMMEDLAYVLSRNVDLRLISNRTTSRYRDQPSDDRAIGAKLQVRYLLKGSVDAEDNALRVSVALVDPKLGQNIWTANFERLGTDRNAIQDEIINSLGRELQIEVRWREVRSLSEPLDLRALIFRGYAALADSATSGLPALKLAEQNFSQALKRDPDNPRARVGLGAYHVRMAVQLFASEPAPHLAQAEELLQSVIERSTNNSAAHKEMGLLQIARGRGDLAMPFFEKAIEINPSEAEAHAQIGRMLVREGRATEGLERVLYAMRLSPRDPVMVNWLGFAGSAELELKHHVKAIEFLERAIALHPTQPRNRLALVAAHAMAGNLESARSQLTDLQKTLPHLSGDKLIARFFGSSDKPGWSELREGLRLALAPAGDPGESPAPPLATAEAPTPGIR